MPALSVKLVVVASTAALAFAAGCSSASSGPGSYGYESSSGAGAANPSGSGGATNPSGSGGSSGGTSSGTASSSGSGSGSGGSSGGSSSSSGSGGGGGTTITTSTTWNTGQTLSSSVTIAPGATVTIAPGATVNVASGVTVTVEGTLTASSATTHAKLTGSSWTGLVVAGGGTLSLDGVDLSGASTALDVQKGAASAEYDDGTVTAASTPFHVESGGALGTKHASVTGTLGSSQIAGSFTASYLSYDSNGNSGIVTTDPGAQLSIEDSTLKGSGPVADMLIAQGGAAKFHVAYTDISNVHCGFHFDTLGEFDISYVNDHGNAWGAMLYGSGGAGPFTISNSNIDNNSAYAYDAQGQNSPITIDGSYVSGTTNPGTVVSVTNPQSAAVPGTGPR